jgi:hypothetical protein
MSEALSHCPAVTATPSNVSVPAVGTVAICTARKPFAPPSAASLKPNAAVVKTYGVSSTAVTVEAAPVGASLTAVTSNPNVRAIASTSVPPAAVPPSSRTWNVNVA